MGPCSPLTVRQFNLIPFLLDHHKKNGNTFKMKYVLNRKCFLPCLQYVTSSNLIFLHICRVSIICCRLTRDPFAVRGLNVSVDPEILGSDTKKITVPYQPAGKDSR